MSERSSKKTDGKKNQARPGVTGLFHFYLHMSVQNKLRLIFILLILLPAAVIGIVYYSISSRTILDISSENILDVVVKNTELIDRQLGYVEKGAVNLNTDYELFQIFSQFSAIEDYELSQYDRDVAQILNKYFPIDGLVSCNIMTRRYMLGTKSIAMPPDLFFESGIYRQVVDAENARWIPAYQVSEALNLDFPVWDYTHVFTLVQPLNPVRISNNLTIHLPEEGLEVLLIMHFGDDLFEEMFQNSITAEGAYYLVTSPTGTIVSHSDKSQIAQEEEIPWLEGLSGAGSIITDYGDTEVLICYTQSEVTGWISAVVVPVAGLLNNVITIQTVSLFLCIFVLFLSMLLAYVFSHRITLPIKNLAHAMKKMGQGEFNQHLVWAGGDELEYLTKRFNQMGDEIQILIRENYEGKLREKEAEIMALDLQLNPHFLHNTLNIINMLALENNQEQISKIVVSLSNMLQYTLQNPQELVTFEDEYIWIQNYVYIMKLRFAGQFRVNFQIEPELFRQKVPKLLMQPLIENSIYHGFRTIDRVGYLEISGGIDEGNVVLCVRDNGRGMTEEELQNAMTSGYDHIGLSNTIRRMELIYGEEQEISIVSKPNEGTTITLQYPVNEQ